MRMDELKIKRKMLALEAKTIRREERDILMGARELTFRKRLVEKGYSDRQVQRIVKRMLNRVPKRLGLTLQPVPGLEAPKQEWIAREFGRFHSLHGHRTVAVRKEARAAHLAYGFLRGVPLHVMEAGSYSPPPYKAIKEIAERFGDGYRSPIEGDNRPLEQLFDEWKQDPHSADGKWKSLPPRPKRPRPANENGGKASP